MAHPHNLLVDFSTGSYFYWYLLTGKVGFCAVAVAAVAEVCLFVVGGGGEVDGATATATIFVCT